MACTKAIEFATDFSYELQFRCSWYSLTWFCVAHKRISKFVVHCNGRIALQKMTCIQGWASDLTEIGFLVQKAVEWPMCCSAKSQSLVSCHLVGRNHLMNQILLTHLIWMYATPMDMEWHSKNPWQNEHRDNILHTHQKRWAGQIGESTICKSSIQ